MRSDLWNESELSCLREIVHRFKQEKRSQYSMIKELRLKLPNRSWEAIRAKVKQVLYPINL